MIWGHPIHSHTHSYVHEGFARAFRWLGAETVWTADPLALRGLDLAGTLFLTEGQALGELPLRRDCHYVLHNVDHRRYAAIADRVLSLQVHDDSIRARHASGGTVEKLNEYTFVDGAGGAPLTLHQPWATDLLPHELDLDVGVPAPRPRSKLGAWIRRRRSSGSSAAWVGTIGRGEYGNADQIEPFRRACEQAGVTFVHRQNIARAQHIALVRRSRVAPAIAGRWQLEHGYVPCRIFKNISYGRLGVTNSAWVQGIFDTEILCHPNTEELFWIATNFARERATLAAQMKEVKARHTFVNRIEQIVDCLP